MGDMGPQVRLVEVGTGLHGKGLPPGQWGKVLVEENDKGAGDMLTITALPRE